MNPSLELSCRHPGDRYPLHGGLSLSMVKSCDIFSFLPLKPRFLFMIPALFLLTACSERTAYEALFQMRYQQCLQESFHPATDCPDSPGYDEYQREYQRRTKPVGTD
jgi:hypothetical protein